jgi:molybdate transport system regulatory protein
MVNSYGPSSRSPRSSRSGATKLRPGHKVWFTLGNSFLMGPNYFRFLRAVDETGTIRQAGKVVGWSYRTCLNRIRRMEETLGKRVLETARGGSSGGGARLSREGHRLVVLFERWQRDMAEYSARAFERALRR